MLTAITTELSTHKTVKLALVLRVGEEPVASVINASKCVPTVEL